MTRRLPVCLVAVVSIAVGLFGCGADSGDSASILRRGNGGDPGTLDPAFAEDEHAFRVLNDLYEGLVVFDAAGALAAGVADDWNVSADGLSYTFRLRPDARWSNGEAVTAAHFVAGFERALAPQSGSTYAFLLHPIRNARQVQRGELPMTELGVRAPDPGTLIIELETPAAHFLSVLTMAIALPEPPAGHGFTNPEDFIGNGPYLLREWQVGHRIRLEKNPTFHDSDSVAIDVVEYYAVEDLQSEFNMYRAGELDITSSVPGPHVDDVRESRPDEFRVAPKLGLYYLAFDLSEAPLDDRYLRQALSLAIDRDALARIVGRGEQPAYGLVPDGLHGYTPARYDWRALSDTDRERTAKYALALSDYDRSLTLTLTYDTDDVHERIALAVSGMWRDVLGIDVVLDKREWQYFLETRNRRDQWQIMRFAWIGDYNHPSTFTDILRSESRQNLPAYRNGAYDRLLDTAATMPTLQAQAAVIGAAEAMLLDDYPIAPLYFYVSKHLVKPRVQGFVGNVLDQHPSRYLSIAAP